MKQKYPLRYLNRQLNESEEDYNTRRECIFETKTDVIDFYGWCFADNGYLSKEQCEDLEEAAECMAAFGERGQEWYNDAQKLLRKNKELIIE